MISLMSTVVVHDFFLPLPMSSPSLLALDLLLIHPLGMLFVIVALSILRITTASLLLLLLSQPLIAKLLSTRLAARQL